VNRPSDAAFRGLPSEASGVIALVARLVGVLVVSGWASQVIESAVGLDQWTAAVLAPLLVMVLAAPATWLLVVLPARALLRRSAEVREAREEELRAQAERQEFDGVLRRAFELARDEGLALDVVARAGQVLSPEAPVELLLTDSSDAHLRRAVVSDGSDGTDGCQVTETWSCPAMATGRTRTFANTHALDTCPSLRNRQGGDRSALCVPVNFLGRALGVLHRVAEPDVPPGEEVVQRMRLLGGQTGATLGMLRVLARSQLQASTDALTGLLNRRSLLESVALLERSGRPYTVLMLDLDRFKQLNDAHGHETGDRALRLFARVLRDSVRDGDLVGRYGGEEFLVVLPGQDAESGSLVAQRVRRALAAALAAADEVPFTTSIGVGESSDAASFEEVVREADAALFEAKHQGRDRVCVASAPRAVLPEQRASNQDEDPPWRLAK
jgi:diguanylate cyclase (GGDEF)-like protein